MDQAGVLVTGLGVAVPGHQAWHRVVTTMEVDLGLFPGRLGHQSRQPVAGLDHGKEMRLVAQFSVGQLERDIVEQIHRHRLQGWRQGPFCASQTSTSTQSPWRGRSRNTSSSSSATSPEASSWAE
ncbi:hypothetical protein D3C80_1684090 [compost metagenome]